MAETCTVSLDTAKVRLQLQKVLPTEKPKYCSVFQAVPRMAMEEGPRALFYGLVPGIHRQFIFVGVGNGVYVPLRNAIVARSKSGDDNGGH